MITGDFWWGTAASSTQSEGAAPASDWLQWEEAGRVPRSGRGNGFGSRYEEDFAMLAGLGLRHHRLSVEWARVEPELGRRDPEAVAKGGSALRGSNSRLWRSVVGGHVFIFGRGVPTVALERLHLNGCTCKPGGGPAQKIRDGSRAGTDVQSRKSSPMIRMNRGSKFRLVAASTTMALLLLFPAGPPASADPASDYRDALARLEALQSESDVLVDRYNEVADEVDSLTATIADSRARVQELRSWVDENLVSIRRQAIDAYKYGARPVRDAGMLAGADDVNAYLRARKYLDAVQGRSVDSVGEFRRTREALDVALARLSAEEARKERLLADLAGRKVAIEASIAEQQAIVDRFRTELQREAAEDATAVQQLLAAGLMPAATTQQAAGAIEWARARLGTPYCWGGTGPGCYDCSGLIQKAYASVGVFLPRTSYQMKSALPQSTEPVPGDIAWHPGHVGLYIGAGYTIEAPRTGDVVRYRAVADRYSVFLEPASVASPPSDPGAGDGASRGAE